MPVEVHALVQDAGNQHTAAWLDQIENDVVAIVVFPIPFANVFIRAAELIGSFCNSCKSIQQAGHIRVRCLEILYFCIVLRI